MRRVCQLIPYDFHTGIALSILVSLNLIIMQKRVFENPLIKDKVTLLESSRETGGAYTLVEVELQPRGGNSLHYHTTFTEEFTAVEGVLGVDLNKQEMRLQPGRSFIVPIGKLHRFYNPGGEPIRFHVKIAPGHERFEQALAIAYGLASDGLVSKKGIPKKFDHAAVIFAMSDTGLTGFFSVLQPIFKWRAGRARKRGVDKELIARYC